jgi:dTDP-4-amino-4,6-dideoxygalactose transaminase
MKYMKYNGISTGIHYDAAHLHPVLGISNSECPESEIKSLRTISIPFNERLTNSDVMLIIKLIKKFNDKQHRENKLI